MPTNTKPRYTAKQFEDLLARVNAVEYEGAKRPREEEGWLCLVNRIDKALAKRCGEGKLQYSMRCDER